MTDIEMMSKQEQFDSKALENRRKAFINEDMPSLQ